jgi:manganese/zinc/iron transport system substrate-binding protein
MMKPDAPGGWDRARGSARARRWLAAAAAMLATSGCAPGESADDGRLRVVATTSLVADLAASVGGEHVSVVGLMGPGIDPHLYIASEGDVRRLSGADLILYTGLQLEAKMASVLQRLAARQPVAAVGEAVPVARLLTPPEFEGAHDPHIWFDVTLWQQAAGRVAEALAEVDPANAVSYQANLRSYLAELDELHAYVRAQAERVPAEQRVLVTAHDAFNYFGRAYDFEVRGLQGISTATEAGTADVQALAGFIVGRRIPAIFIESSVSPRAVEAVRAAVRARGYGVRLGGELYSDALGSPGTQAESYVGMMRHNIDTIVSGLLTQPEL